MEVADEEAVHLETQHGGLDVVAEALRQVDVWIWWCLVDAAYEAGIEAEKLAPVLRVVPSRYGDGGGG